MLQLSVYYDCKVIVKLACHFPLYLGFLLMISTFSLPLSNQQAQYFGSGAGLLDIVIEAKLFHFLYMVLGC